MAAVAIYAYSASNFKQDWNTNLSETNLSGLCTKAMPSRKGKPRRSVCELIQAAVLGRARLTLAIYFGSRDGLRC